MQGKQSGTLRAGKKTDRHACVCMRIFCICLEDPSNEKGYLHLSAHGPQPITHREMDVIQMSESFQWHVLPEPRVRVLIKCISQAAWIKPELNTTKANTC